MLFKAIFLWFPPVDPITMTGPQLLAVSRHTFDKCLPRALAKPVIIDLLIICSGLRFSDAGKRVSVGSITDYPA